MRRRDVFDPENLARAAGRVLGLRDPDEAIEKADDVSLLRFSRRAMATLFEVLFPCGTPAALEAGNAALDEIDRLEDQLTVYRDHSEVSRINRQAAVAAVPVEPRLFELFALAQELAGATHGAFDISVGALIKAWGFYRRAGRIPSPDERAEVMTRVGMQHVMLDHDRRTIAFARPGIEINLGSIGKGFALDRVVELLRTEWSIARALVHGGHSSIVAMGSEPGSGHGWQVGIADPVYPKRRLAIIRLKDRALGTSAMTFQHLQHEGRKLGHILDPRTGWPAEKVLSASVLAPTAAVADALATAFYVNGVDWACDYCVKHADVAALLVPLDRRPVAIGIPAADWKLT